MRHPNILRPTKLTLMLPEDIRARIDLHLWSEIEGRVPFGAYQRFFIELVKEFFSDSIHIHAENRRVVKLLMEKAFQDLSQEWWAENFPNPESAYNVAKILLEGL